MTPFDSRVRPAGLLLALALVAACGSSDKQETTTDIVLPVRPQIASFEASPASIVAGDSVTLSWTTRDVVSISLADDTGTPISVDGLSPEKGSIAVVPTRTTAYTFTATGAEESQEPARRTVTVRVEIPGVDPVIESFSATPAEVLPGGEVRLSWRTTGATALTLKDDAGEAIDCGAASLEDGLVIVRPTRSRTLYTLVATGNGKQTSMQTSVDILGLPGIRQFYVQPIEPVVSGTPVALKWETVQADRVVITDDAGATILDSTTALSGSHSPTLTRTTEYTLTASGNGATTTARVLAQVGARIDEFTASPSVAWAGDAITLSWKTGGADSITITAPGGYSYQVPAADILEGSTVTTLIQSGDYVLSARIGTVVQTWAVYVEATAAPRIVRPLVANPPVVTSAPDYPNVVAITFVQNGGTSCVLYRNGVAVPGYNPFPCVREQTVEVELTGAADIRLVAANDAGKDEAGIHIDAVDPARIVSFTKTPERRVIPGAPVELAWEVTDAVVVRMERDGRDLGISGFTGSRTETVQQTTVYRLIAENSIGHPTTSIRTIYAGAPEIRTFGPTANVVVPNDPVTFEWTCDGGDLLVLTVDDQEKFRTTSQAEIDAGSTTFAAPGAPGWHTYTLTVRDAADQETTDSFSLFVTDGPLIRSFIASTNALSIGETLDLTWTATRDAAGVSPTLVLEDNFGTPYDLTGLAALGATFSFVPETRGNHVFTFTASTADTTPSIATVAVSVGDAPRIVSFTADPPVFKTDGSSAPLSATLEWETENAVELAIYELDASGAAIPSPLLRLSLADGATKDELDHHGVVVRPLESTQYLLTIRNVVGTTLEEAIWVLVDPAEVLTFDVDPVEIFPGETSTLSWTTTNAVRLMLQPPVPVVTEIPESWVDISENPAAQVVATLNTSNDSWTSVAFPGEFRFPFDGEMHAATIVSMNGFLSFSKEIRNNSNSSNVALPTPTSTCDYVHLAPWWDILQSYTKGKVYTLYDDTARTFTVMWKNWSYRSTAATFDFNFEVVLHENGNFEYRYGAMTATNGTTYENFAACSSCTIGFQDLSRSFGRQIRLNERFDDASNLGWFFEVAPSANGSREVAPTADQIYKLTALDNHVAASESVAVKVWPIPAVSVIAVYPAGPEIGVPYTVSWTASSVTRVRLLDSEGEILCEEANPDRLANGSCELTETEAGARNYTLEVINGLERNKMTYPVNFAIYDTLSLESFSVSDTFIQTGKEVTVVWRAQGAFEAELWECAPGSAQAKCVRIDIRSADPNGGSYSASPAKSTEYRFRVSDRYGRMEEASANVWVDIPKIASLTAPKQIAVGRNATLSWATDGSVTLSNFGRFQEVWSPYQDISNSGEKAVRTSGDANGDVFMITFPESFQFPYYGNVYTAISVRSNGWAGFDQGNVTTLNNNSALPNATYKQVQLAPFWDHLKIPEEGGIYYKVDTVEGSRALIVQWTHMGFGGAATYTGDLNFQVVLFESGRIRYRYGVMSSSTPSYANGGGASIGFQNLAGTAGASLGNNTVHGGGLSNRSWAITTALESEDEVMVMPKETTTYKLCVNNESLYEVCDEIRVVVIGPGDVMITEVMVTPSEASDQWFEVRNIGLDPIDLEGFEIVSGPAETYLIPAGPSTVTQRGAFAVMAKSNKPLGNGGPTPVAVYDNAIALDEIDELVLQYMGITIDSLSWERDWPLSPNRSMVLEQSKFERTDAVNDEKEDWCASSEVYDGVLVGSPGRLGAGCRYDGVFAYYLLDAESAMPFIDIAKTGIKLTLDSSLNYSAPILLPFTFEYFEVPVEEMTVLRDGAVAMVTPTGAIAASNSAIPNADILPNGLIAPMWDILHPAASGTIHYDVVDNGIQRAMIVQWTDFGPFSSNAAYGRTTFQVQLWNNGDIVFVYGPNQPGASYPNYTYIYGSSATIGLENDRGDLGFQYFYGTEYSGVRPVWPGKALHFHAK